MMIRNVLIAVICAAVLAVGCNKQQPETTYAAIEKMGDVLWKDTAAAGVADGAHVFYLNLKRVKRPDFRVVQDGGSGTVSFRVFASWSPDAATGAAATYDDVGLDFYGAATFAGATTKLLDDGAKLRTASWFKIVFTVAGAAADASYTIDQALELAGD